MDLFYKDGLNFSCKQCSHCCKDKPGVVYISKSELQALCKKVNLTQEQFVKVYCRWVEQPDGAKKLSLRELSNYDCIFWQKGIGCTVYEERPVQCRTYPFWSNIMQSKESWQKEAKECPGINTGCLHTQEEITEKLCAYQNRSIITFEN